MNKMSVQEIMEMVSRAIAPPMTLGEALEFLESLASDVEMHIDAIKDDMRNKGQDWG